MAENTEAVTVIISRQKRRDKMFDLIFTEIINELVEKAEELANVQSINIGQALINSGILAEDTLLKFLESKLHIPYVNLEDYEPDTKCFKYVSFADARRYRIIPLFKIEDVLIDVENILNGVYDQVDESKFLFIGKYHE